MPYVIDEPCLGVKDRACVEVCPVDCIHDSPESPQMFINPEECIDCSNCEPECPVGAIYQDVDLPPKWKHFEAINAEFFR